MKISERDISAASFAPYIDILLDEFNSRFKQFNDLEPVIQFFINPFQIGDVLLVSDTIRNYFGTENYEELELEIITMKNDVCLKSYNSDANFWNLVDGNKFPILRTCALKIHAYSASTYSCEALFSTLKHLKSKYRSRLTNTNLDHCLRAGTSKYEPDFIKLSTEMQSQVSH